jgi:hypothetical protein
MAHAATFAWIRVPQVVTDGGRRYSVANNLFLILRTRLRRSQRDSNGVNEGMEYEPVDRVK